METSHLLPSERHFSADPGLHSEKSYPWSGRPWSMKQQSPELLGEGRRGLYASPRLRDTGLLQPGKLGGPLLLQRVSNASFRTMSFPKEKPRTGPGEGLLLAQCVLRALSPWMKEKGQVWK